MRKINVRKIFNILNYKIQLNTEGQKKQIIVLYCFRIVPALMLGSFFITNYMQSYGLSDEQIARVSSLVYLSGIVSLFAVAIYPKKMKLPHTLVILKSIMIFGIVALMVFPVIFDNKMISLYGAVLIIAISYNLSVSGNDKIIMDTIDMENRSKVQSINFTLGAILRSVFIYFCGNILDFFNEAQIGFNIIFSIEIALLIGLIITYFKINKVKEYYMDKIQDNIFKSFLIPFKDKAYLQYMLMYSVICVGLGVVSGYRNLFLLNYMEISNTYFSILTVIYTISAAIFLIMWDRLSEKIGWFRIYALGCCVTSLFCFSYVLMPATFDWLLPISMMLFALGNTGVAFGLYFVRHNHLIPKEKRITYDSVFTGIACLASSASILGITLLRNVFPEIVNIGNYNFVFYKQIFFIAAIIYIVMGVFFIPMIRKRYEKIQ